MPFRSDLLKGRHAFSVLYSLADLGLDLNLSQLGVEPV